MKSLEEYDFIVVGDCSSSMQEPVKAGSSTTRWDAMQESIKGFVRDVGKLDSDGIDFVELGGQGRNFRGVTSDNVVQMLSALNPRGSTPLAEALVTAIALAGKSDKKDFICVYTDGVPDDQKAVVKVITDQANKQVTDDELTILFIQVGDDARATQFLRDLDDNLKGAKFDIVDAKTIEEADKFPTTAALIEAAIND